MNINPVNECEIHQYVQRYLDATNCTILEKASDHFIVKLSPDADRALTNRPYYWGFVDRVGVEPETMSFLFVTNSKQYDLQEVSANIQQADNEFASETAEMSGSDAHLVRSLGFVPASLQEGKRYPRENLYFGARKLEQIFDAAKESGSYVCLFEQPHRRNTNPFESAAYTAWLGVNLKVEYICDQKKEEIYCFGVSLITGHCVEGFHDKLLKCRLSPQLPSNIHIAKNGVTATRALQIIEQTLERKLKQMDYGWAEQASLRLEEELERVSSYYNKLLEHTLEENKAGISEQFEQRKSEIRQQYEPRVIASAINCGIFHLEGID